MNLYDVAVPTFKRSLTSLRNILAEGEAHAKDKGFEAEVLLNARLAPDMFPLTRQIQIASDAAKRGAGELAGVEIPVFADNEKTFEDLYARIDKTLAFLDGLTQEQFEGAEMKTIELALPGGKLPLPAPTFLMSFAFANFSFHVATAYNILRHNGVAIGKMDYLGAP